MREEYLLFYEMLAGIGIFLLGMNFLEDTLKSLVGRPFKLFLRKQTRNKFKAIGGGALLTGVLQSSSVVNLMVLAFVGAGVLTLQNALAVMLGSNIGTTLTSWLIATLGFKIDVHVYSFPIVGISGIVMAMFRQGRIYQYSKFAFGLGALFVGLGFIKSGFEDLVIRVDFTLSGNYPDVVYLIAGFILTSLVQSSSTTVAITLSALHVNAISLQSAMAMALGSEVGTTIKLLLASAHGIPAKKRVAYGNFIYNAFVIILFMIILSPVHHLISEVLDIKDNLMALVIFQSGINIAGVIIFYPFLNYFGDFLERRFKEDNEGCRYIPYVPSGEGELALDAFDKEARWFIDHTLAFIMDSFGVHYGKNTKTLDKRFVEKSHSDKYDHLKRLYGEMHSYYMRIDKEAFTEDEKERADQMMSSVRNTMFAAKSIKDSFSDINQFKNSSNDAKYRMYLQTRASVMEFCEQVDRMLNHHEAANRFEEIVRMYDELQKGYTENLRMLYREGDTSLNEVEISTFINFNREIYSTYKALIWAIKDYLLDKKQSEYFTDLPGFIR